MGSSFRRGGIRWRHSTIGFATTVSLQEVAPNASYLFPYVLHPLHIIVPKKAYDALPSDGGVEQES